MLSNYELNDKKQITWMNDVARFYFADHAGLQYKYCKSIFSHTVFEEQILFLKYVLFEIGITNLPATTQNLNANVSHKLTLINREANMSVEADFVTMQP